MIIYKYQLKTDEENKIELPVGSQVIHVNQQNDIPCIWVLLADNTEKEVRNFFCIVTGMEFTAQKYWGTCHINSGKFVLHVFE